MPPQQGRKELRVDIDSAVLPFLGSRIEDHQPFEYLLQDLSEGGVRVAIPSWLSGRERLNKGDRIDFHVPFEVDGRALGQGVVAWEKWDEEQDAQVVGAALDRFAPINYPVYISIGAGAIALDLQEFQSKEDLLERVVKDSVLLKRGILVYLKHLASYFARVTVLDPEEYALFREVILEDTRSKVKANAEYLGELLARIQAERENSEDTVTSLDLEQLRLAMEPEIYADLFQPILEKGLTATYIDAIKLLEKKLYANYNTVVMLYLRSL